jgi:hypothetical protein
MRTMHSVLIGLAAVSLVSCASGGMGHHGGSSNAPLAQEVRRATERYRDVKAATAAGYAVFLGCVSSPQGGAMGIHYVNGDLVGDGKLDAARPEALMYEPKGGKLELVGVEYIVIAAAWDAANKTPPTLMGQLFHYNTSPNRYGIPAYYALHVWAWKENPHGVFMDWNPRVSCEGYRAGSAR